MRKEWLLLFACFLFGCQTGNFGQEEGGSLPGSLTQETISPLAAIQQSNFLCSDHFASVTMISPTSFQGISKSGSLQMNDPFFQVQSNLLLVNNRCSVSVPVIEGGGGF